MNARHLFAIRLITLSASLIYLVCELAFHVHLVDLLSTHPPKQDIEQVEQAGRLLTGIAAALLVVPLIIMIVLRQTLERRAIPLALLTIIVTIGGTWASIAVARTGIEWIAEKLTERRTADQRRQAVLSLFIVSHLHARQDDGAALTVNGKDVPAYLKETVPGRFVLAALPFLLSNVGDLEERTRQQMRAILASDLEKEVGTPEKAYNEVYVKSMQGLTQAYEAYREATSTYSKRIKESERDAFSDWEDYTSELARNRLTPFAVSRSAAIRNKVAETLRRKDPALPANWVPESAEDFRVVRTGRLQKAYAAALGQMGFSKDTPPINTFEQFLAHPHIDKQWCAEFANLKAELKDSLCKFKPREGSSEAVFPAFRDEVFKPVVERKLNELAARYGSPAADYAEGGKLGKEGYEAARIAVVIPIALLFSLLGGVAHVVKCTIIVTSFFKSLLLRLLLPGGLALALGTLMAQPAPLADDGFVAAMRQSIRERYGEFALLTGNSAMNLEKAVYPVGKAIPIGFEAGK